MRPSPRHHLDKLHHPPAQTDATEEEALHCLLVSC
jgi:hypothetical protein